MGVNTFMALESESESDGPVALMRSTTDEKERQIRHVEEFQAAHRDQSDSALVALQNAAKSGKNTFESLMDAVRVCSLGQITHALFDVGGQYRRNM